MPPTDPQHAPSRHPLWVVPACALAAILPMLLHGFSCGNDLTFHMQGWMEAARSWHQHVLLPRWVASAAWGAGEPRFVFYPPLSWILGGIIGSVSGWNAAPFVYSFLVVVLAGCTSYRLARSVVSPAAALACAVLYMLNPYALFVLYTRAAFAELLAAALLPWLFLEALRPQVRIRTFALAVCAVWLSNAPAAVLAMYSLAVLAVVRALTLRDWRPLLRTAVATALGLALCGFYLVPAAYERRWVQIGRVIGDAYDFHRNFPFPFTGNGDPLHDLLLRHAARITAALLLVTSAALAMVLRRRSGDARALALYCLLPVSLLMLCSCSAFAWSHLPQLRFLQFPWRWLMVLAVVYAAATAAALASSRPAVRATATCAIALCSLVACSATLRQACDPEDTPAGIRAQFASRQGFEATDEYEPNGADDDDLRPDPEHPGYPRVWLYREDDAADVAGPPQEHLRMLDPITITRWRGQEKQFQVRTQIAAVAVLQLRDYPAWQVTIDGANAAKLPPASSGQMQLALPPGEHTVTLRYRRTRDEWIGVAVTILAVIVFAAIAG